MYGGRPDPACQITENIRCSKEQLIRNKEAQDSATSLGLLIYSQFNPCCRLIVLRTQFAYGLTCTPHLHVVHVLQLFVQLLTIVGL